MWGVPHTPICALAPLRIKGGVLLLFFGGSYALCAL
jgi:hypothetical protein